MVAQMSLRVAEWVFREMLGISRDACRQFGSRIAFESIRFQNIVDSLILGKFRGFHPYSFGTLRSYLKKASQPYVVNYLLVQGHDCLPS
jgi:hypothetical protein